MQDPVSGSVQLGPELLVVASVVAIGSFVPGSAVVEPFVAHPVPVLVLVAVEGTVVLVAVAFVRSTCHWKKCSTVLTRCMRRKGFHCPHRPGVVDQRLHCRNKRRRIFGTGSDQLWVLG